MRQDGLVMPTTVSTTDYHTAGEPFRIVADPPVTLPGSLSPTGAYTP
jgi:hypothetical protein